MQKKLSKLTLTKAKCKIDSCTKELYIYIFISVFLHLNYILDSIMLELILDTTGSFWTRN